MAKKFDPPPKPSRILSQDEIRAAISRLEKRVEELGAFDTSTMTNGISAELKALSTAIEDSIGKTFGHDTPEFRRYAEASKLAYTGPGVWFTGMPETPASEKRAAVRKNIESAKALIGAAIASLKEDLTIVPTAVGASQGIRPKPGDSRRIFIVHGHDESARETVARFLEKLKFEVIILHEQANKGRTIIEKVEAHGDVSFAVVLLTPDDMGCAEGGKPEPRARQNVILELGYFIARLGRDRVCALKKGNLEVPSDFVGVVYTPLDTAGAWKMALAKELEAAGHTLDWNSVMKS